MTLQKEPSYFPPVNIIPIENCTDMRDRDSLALVSQTFKPLVGALHHQQTEFHVECLYDRQSVCITGRLCRASDVVREIV